jgi:hypothetical protein
MKCSNPNCDRAIGLVAYQRSWFSKGRYCSQRCCRGVVMADAANAQQKPVLKSFIVAFVAFIGLIVPATARPEPPHLPGCERNIADASISVAAMQALIKSLGGADRSEVCTATRLYFFEVVKARAVTALCKNGAELERDLGRFDADVAHADDAIAARCL